MTVVQTVYLIFRKCRLIGLYSSTEWRLDEIFPRLNCPNVSVKLGSWPSLCCVVCLFSFFNPSPAYSYIAVPKLDSDDILLFIHLSLFLSKGGECYLIYLWNESGFSINVLKIQSVVTLHSDLVSTYKRGLWEALCGMLLETEISSPCRDIEQIGFIKNSKGRHFWIFRRVIEKELTVCEWCSLLEVYYKNSATQRSVRGQPSPNPSVLTSHLQYRNHSLASQ